MKLRAIEESLFNTLDHEIQESLRASGVVPVNDKYMPVYERSNEINTICFIGGRGGVKTTEGSRFVTLETCANAKRTVILRDEKELVRESILNEVHLRFSEHDQYWNFSRRFNKIDSGIKERETGEMAVFTKGFRTSANDKKANLKSVSNVDIALVEEIEDVRDEEKFNVFSDSIRKKGSLTVIILNTPDIDHWIIKRWFKLIPITINDENGRPVEGYFDIVPKDIPGFLCIKTSFLDNPHLPDHIIERYKAYGDPKSHLYNLHYFLTAICGYASTGRKGQILKKVKYISLQEYLALPYKEFYGQDFGTASPAGLVGVKRHRNTSWCRQINYLPSTTLGLGRMYSSLKIHPTRDKIIADNADPKSINKLHDGWNIDEIDPQEFKIYPPLHNGWDIEGCVKGADSVTYGLDAMTEMNLFAVTESEDLWNEIRKYVYAQDKNGNYTNDPIDDFNHLIDPWRYVINYLDREQGVAGSGMRRRN